MPTDLEAIIQAKIATLEEEAGKLKALSELKLRIADDEHPPKKPEKFRETALEHKQDAIAVLTAVQTLKFVLSQRRTKAKQIAILKRYVQEFSESASLNAIRANGLADDDPQKAEVEQNGLSDSFVVSVLNSILSEIGPQPSMAGRLGQVLNWAANCIRSRRQDG
jgi:hypothetical protein